VCACRHEARIPRKTLYYYHFTPYTTSEDNDRWVGGRGRGSLLFFFVSLGKGRTQSCSVLTDKDMTFSCAPFPSL